jgi:hypothetical protein
MCCVEHCGAVVLLARQPRGRYTTVAFLCCIVSPSPVVWCTALSIVAQGGHPSILRWASLSKLCCVCSVLVIRLHASVADAALCTGTIMYDQ